MDRPHQMRTWHRQAGLSLVELMIAIAVGMFIVVTAAMVFVSVKAAYTAQAEAAQVLDTGRHAIEIVSRSVRQASYLGFDDPAVHAAPAVMAPAILGLDTKSLKSRTPGIDTPVAKSVNGSDVLAVRFPGAGKGSNGDGTVVNCAGFGVGRGEPDSEGDARSWSVFYVGEDGAGEPELYCKYPGNEAWASQAIARGVESFQVLYALDTDADGMPDTFLNASAIDALDASAGTSGAAGESHWKQVVAVRVAVLVRGGREVGGQLSDARFDLFGAPYSDAFAGRDRGVRIRVDEQPKPVRRRVRRVFSTTIWLRSGMRGGAP